jgi:hypothetical protein
MKTPIRWMPGRLARLGTLGWLAPLALVACATSSHPRAKPSGAAPTSAAASGVGASAAAAATDSTGKITPQLRSGSNELRSFSVDTWIAPDDHTLILDAVDRSLFAGRFKSACTGLRLVNTIAFIVPTPPQVDKYQGVVLPDGRRCSFTSLTRVDTSLPQVKDSTANSNL